MKIELEARQDNTHIQKRVIVALNIVALSLGMLFEIDAQTLEEKPEVPAFNIIENSRAVNK